MFVLLTVDIKKLLVCQHPMRLCHLGFEYDFFEQFKGWKGIYFFFNYIYFRASEVFSCFFMRQKKLQNFNSTD